HEAVALGAPPDAAARAAVHEAHAALGQDAGPAHGVVPVGVAAVDDHVARCQQPSELGGDRLGDLPGRDHEPDDPGRLQPGHEVGERRHLGSVAGGVVADHLVARLGEPGGHVAAHPAEAHHAELHVPTSSSSSRSTRPARRPRSRSAARSPSAWARCSRAKPYAAPGTGTSSLPASTTWTHTTESGPPLWSCPVEWRNRGPKPRVVATRRRSRSAWRTSSSRAATGAPGSTKAWIAT